ncbi:MAG: nucleotidyltransferase domain-containing protein [Candidatus Kapaibacteriota bacterium]|jgi:predicted nucleotidyltransferase
MLTASVPDTIFRQRIRDTIRAAEPSAECILFGSWARGDTREDSDWDVLVLVDGEIDYERKFRLVEQVLDLEIETCSAISTIMCEKSKPYQH